MQKLLTLLLLAIFLCPSCGIQKPTEILWDEWGVPHIYAQNHSELMFAFGWAQMANHGNTILDLYGKSRGKAAEYWGAQHLENDIIVHTLGFPGLSQNWLEAQQPEMREIIDGFVNGMNSYVEEFPETVEEKNRPVLPISETDIISHFMNVVFLRFIGGGELGKIRNWENAGSNTYAVGPSKSQSGKAMLVMNPHLPWFGEFLFFEAHFNLGDLNCYGVSLVGMPTLGIAFNENLGWSHTNNTIDNADLYRLQLSGKGYVLDGEEKSFEKEQRTIKVKDAEGRINDQTIDIFRSEHGPVISRKEKEALAIRMPGYETPQMLGQWWDMVNAEDFAEFEDAIDDLHVPFWNIMYADKEGNIFYLFNGQVPVRAEGDWDYWSAIIDGTRSDLIWHEVHNYGDLPKVFNPASGWLQNANDPPWTCTVPTVLNPKDYPAYMSPEYMSFRPQRAVRMMREDESISFEELVDIKMSTRFEVADRILDDLFAAVDKYPSETNLEAKNVLEAWDRESNAESKGTLLFYNWFRAMNRTSDKIFNINWTFANPDKTPDGLADPQKAARVLEQVANEIEANYGALDIAWGDVYRIRYGAKDLPGNGADGSVGVFRVAWPNSFEENKYYIGGGDSWQAIVEFGDKVQAKVLLSYGNSSEENSPHFGDQLELFSRKSMREALFYRPDVLAKATRKEVLEGNSFILK